LAYCLLCGDIPSEAVVRNDGGGFVQPGGDGFDAWQRMLLSAAGAAAVAMLLPDDVPTMSSGDAQSLVDAQGEVPTMGFQRRKVFAAAEAMVGQHLAVVLQLADELEQRRRLLPRDLAALAWTDSPMKQFRHLFAKPSRMTVQSKSLRNEARLAADRAAVEFKPGLTIRLVEN
jgi:hypothetical protein